MTTSNFFLENNSSSFSKTEKYLFCSFLSTIGVFSLKQRFNVPKLFEIIIKRLHILHTDCFRIKAHRCRFYLTKGSYRKCILPSSNVLKHNLSGLFKKHCSTVHHSNTTGNHFDRKSSIHSSECKQFIKSV